MRYIQTKTQFEGFHRYPNAPEQVSFLKNKHRHLFGLRVTIEVRDNERELEYFMVLKDVRLIIKRFLKEATETESCESIAEYFLDYLETKYKNRYIQVQVSEDEENSSIVTNKQNDELI